MLDDLSDAAVCATCGRALDGFDHDEDEFGDAGRPICGECARNATSSTSRSRSPTPSATPTSMVDAVRYHARSLTSELQGDGMTVGTMTEGALATRLVGGVWGHIVGDAVGVPRATWPQ